MAENEHNRQGEVRHQADQVSAAFRNRLRDTIEAMGMDNVVRSTGRSAKTLGRYVDGHTEPPFVVIAMLAEAAGVSVTWLATGEGPRDSNSAARHLVVDGGALGGSRMLQLADPEAMEDHAFVLLPRFEVEASAGQGLIPPGEEIRDFVAFAVGHLREAGIDPRQAHVIKVRGRSMMPTLVDGDWVIVDRTKTRVDTGDIYAVIYQEGLRIKRVLKERDAKGREAYVLVSDNTSEGYGDLRIEGPDLADFHVVGRVDRHIRAL